MSKKLVKKREEEGLKDVYITVEREETVTKLMSLGWEKPDEDTTIEDEEIGKGKEQEDKEKNTEDMLNGFYCMHCCQITEHRKLSINDDGTSEYKCENCGKIDVR